jgi:uncharacterized protein (DUF58 family)
VTQESAFDRAKKARAAPPPPIPDASTRPVLPPPVPSLARQVRTQTILEPGDLDPLKNLLLFAQLTVEGWFAGKHRSIDFGTNAEFAEHRHYVPGDPIGDIDWKAYARNRDLVIRKHRAEKDMTSYLVVDVSGSMGYQGAGLESKQLRAARIAAALTYLMQRQGDKSSLALFRNRLSGYIPPGSTRRHLHDVVSMLEKAAVHSTGETEAHDALDLCVPLFKKRGSVVVISDFFTDLDKFFDAVSQFQHRRYQVLLLHIMDPDERDLPTVPLARFVDMESGQSIQVAPDEIRSAYRREMKAMTDRLQEESLRRGIDYKILQTEEPYIEAIEAWLGLRAKANTATQK